MTGSKATVLSVITVLSMAAAAYFAYEARVAPEAAPAVQRAGGGSAGPVAARVVVAPVQTGRVDSRLSAIGTGRALSAVSLTPFSPGRITEIVVKAGDKVEAGDVIARLDSEVEEIAVEKAQVVLDDAQAKVERVTRLRASNAISAVELTTAELERANARLALQDAQLALSRRTVVAPVSGIIGILPINAGNYVTNSTEIATIDDRSKVLVDFWVAERFANQIAPGAKVTATLVADPTVSVDGFVSAVDSKLDEQSRTLRVRAELDNADDRLRAGMSFRMGMSFPGQDYPAVPPLAVQWGAEGSYVWAVRDEKATRIPVTLVQRNAEAVLVAAEFQDNEIIVSEGVQSVREGGAVNIIGREQPVAPAATPDETTAAIEGVREGVRQ
ncbi:efflux RND transporter periplasmic adaptor subunit [Limoniibacter endophyticus]|uniref:Hemolysin secretion protein D n=1 Tax=Limoniibacter endophyticus TaxID=1565040 RepID=A0A8J3DK69_9HYPH|nr:efflux RND transporter periplasmic adaptor subunit [Limoniibacter endophyticus]GHC63991.1 hemolysin secretion protein D [Limoniibacter endophyticus]